MSAGWQAPRLRNHRPSLRGYGEARGTPPSRLSTSTAHTGGGSSITRARPRGPWTARGSRTTSGCGGIRLITPTGADATPESPTFGCPRGSTPACWRAGLVARQSQACGRERPRRLRDRPAHTNKRRGARDALPAPRDRARTVRVGSAELGARPRDREGPAPGRRRVAAVAAVARDVASDRYLRRAWPGVAFRLRPHGTPQGRVGQGHRLARDRAPGSEVQRSEACTGRSLFRSSPGRRAVAARALDAGPWRGPHRGTRRCGRTRANGVASLLVDPPAPEVVTCDAAKDLAIFTRYVIGRRRAVDLALTLPNVNGKRIAAAGFSYGASVTAVLAGVEHRSARSRSSRGAPITPGSCASPVRSSARRSSTHMSKSSQPSTRSTGCRGDASRLPHPGRYARPLKPEADVLALYRAAHGPKELRLYAADHPLNAAATAYRARWLLRELRR